jgi:Na+/phosphate symporter
MNGLQQQIISLDRKVERLHEIVESLSTQIATLAHDKVEHSRRESLEMVGFSELSDNILYDHKDILRDHGGKQAPTVSGDNPFSDEIQIRRLTAQLTAAYNRIAALEEQILTYRIHS